MKRRPVFWYFVCCVAAASLWSAARTEAEPVKLGLLRASVSGPVFIAKEKGYFAQEGLEPQLVFFDGGPPIAVATVSGALDFGIGGLSAALYTMAGEGALRIIAGSYREMPSFRNEALLASNRAYAAGLKSYRDLPGHSFGIGPVGSPPHYSLALLSEKFGFDLASIQLRPLQSIATHVTALAGGQIDAALPPATMALPLIAGGNAKLLGWIGDEVPWQLGAVWVSRKSIIARRATIEAFLRAFRRGSRDYHDAFAGADDKRHDGPKAQEMLAVLSNYLGQPPALIATAIPYVDAEARLDIRDVAHQIAWFQSQGMVKNAPPVEKVIDRHFVVRSNKRMSRQSRRE
jgi:NitT/TauT family transport system substrate-binding protein